MSYITTLWTGGVFAIQRSFLYVELFLKAGSNPLASLGFQYCATNIRKGTAFTMRLQMLFFAML